MASRKKKKHKGGGEFPEQLKRVATIGSMVFGGMLVVYIASFFLFSWVELTQSKYVEIRVRVFGSEFARQFYRPMTFIEKRLFVDYEVAIHAGNPAPTTDTPAPAIQPTVAPASTPAAKAAVAEPKS